MSQTRFVTTLALFETFPQSVTGIAADPTDEPPTAFLKKLSAQHRFKDAITFCAYLLPRREAVWWACGSVRALLGDIAASRAGAITAAEAWVYDPDDEHRRTALEVGEQGDSNDPLTWLALGAGWSGGALLAHPQRLVPVPAYMTPRAARIAILLSARILKPERYTARMQACIVEGIKLAETGL
jgi:uncharacterized protein DUF6931